MNLRDTLTVYATGIEAREFSEGRRKKLAKSGAAMPGGGFPIVNKHDLANAKRAIGRAKNPAAARRHINERAKALGAKPIGASDASDMSAHGGGGGIGSGPGGLGGGFTGVNQKRPIMGEGMMHGVPKLRMAVKKKKMHAYDATSQWQGVNTNMGPAKALDPL